jgi:hypothetical protein
MDSKARLQRIEAQNSKDNAATLATHRERLEAALGKSNVAAMSVYVQLLNRLQAYPPVVYFTTVAPTQDY